MSAERETEKPLYIRQCSQCDRVHEYDWQQACSHCDYKYKNMWEGYQSNFAPSNEDLHEEDPFGRRPPDDALNLEQMAFLISKCMLYAGNISIQIKKGEDLFEDNEILKERLAEHTRKYCDLLISGIDNNQLNSEFVQRNIDGKIIAGKTFINSGTMNDFLQERSLDLGEYFHMELPWREHYLSEVGKAAIAAERIRIDAGRKAGVAVTYSNNDDLVLSLGKKDAEIERLKQALAILNTEASVEARGRKPKYDWEVFYVELITLAQHPDGLPEIQADLEKRMRIWCANTWGTTPTESQIREKISKAYQGIKKGRK